MQLGRSASAAFIYGHPLAMTPEQVRHARDPPTRSDNTVSSIAAARQQERGATLLEVAGTSQDLKERPARVETRAEARLRPSPI
ncbi:hypothetical protein AB0K21_21230 [Streptosporangium sp. NPDC049248]|uniref:hypothetical protein n=1 Tax=Streptosporangium sp. NPDC049248 TaxID=3155651 RepID=UPI0034403C43